MNSKSNNRDGIRDINGYLKLVEHLCEGTEKISSVHHYCKEHMVDMKELWKHMSLYKESGLKWLKLNINMCNYRRDVFTEQKEKLGKKIVSLISRLPGEVHGIFRDLLELTDDLLQRMNFITDVIIYCFLEEEKGLALRSEQTSRYINLLIRMIDEEIVILKETVQVDTIAWIKSGYRDWLEAISRNRQDGRTLRKFNIDLPEMID